jgi:hypothetical protein
VSNAILIDKSRELKQGRNVSRAALNSPDNSFCSLASKVALLEAIIFGREFCGKRSLTANTAWQFLLLTTHVVTIPKGLGHL